MAFTAKSFSIFLLLITLLSSFHTQASKVPNVNPNTKQPPNNQQQEPNFLPENEHPYGLYSQDSGHHPHSTTTPNDNPATNAAPYGPVPYVTEPAEERNSYTTNPNNNHYNGAQNYYNSQQEEEESPYQTYPTTVNSRKTNNYYYNAGRFRGGATLSSRDKYFNNGGGGANNGYDQPRGMSDTRSLENGKYFYDINTDMYSSNHPYETLRRIGARNEYNKMNNAYEFNGENSMGGYQNQDEFQDEINNMP